MPRPRKNPNDPKWTDETASLELAQDVAEPQEVSDTPTEIGTADVTAKKVYLKKEPNFNQDLLALHTELGLMDFIKGATGNTGAREYSYQDLPSLMKQVNPVLHFHNFVWFSKPTTDSIGNPVLLYILRHVSGVTDEGQMPMKLDNIKPQDYGSLITYFRRYALTAQLGIVADKDDDAKTVNDVIATKEVEAKTVTTAEMKKYIQYIEAITSKLEYDIDPTIYDMTHAELVTEATRLKKILDDKTA